MLPWVYEFHWTPFHIIFLLVFFSVFATIAITIVKAMQRTRDDFVKGNASSIQWHSDFEDLSPLSKACRHELSGEISHRICDNGFDCRSCSLHPVLAAKNQSTTKSETLQFDIYGFMMPPYRLYHRGHTWVQKESDGTYTAGLDDFGERLIGRPQHAVLPPIGTSLQVNGTGWNVIKGKSMLRILSPLDGIVVDHGNSEKGWVLKIRPNDPVNGTQHLLHGNEIRIWIMREMERLQYSFQTAGVGLTLADGGELSSDFHHYYPKADWDGILGQIFLEA